MIDDPIVNEVRQNRQKIFAQCDNNLAKLLAWLREQEKQDAERLVQANDVLPAKAT
ncbi:hypothetical protein JW998_09740 [candidate division KSB1 bacterium]|nr:hypothetical protein [candidate division KSB1 bacterium]